ncbi:hypothetical protein J0H58_03255 [bacterium]|nr:hypothetical protein [bacterium]
MTLTDADVTGLLDEIVAANGPIRYGSLNGAPNALYTPNGVLTADDWSRCAKLWLARAGKADGDADALVALAQSRVYGTPDGAWKPRA